MQAFIFFEIYYGSASGVISLNKEIIYVRIDENIKKKLDMLALAGQRSLNNLVVYILTKYLENHNETTSENIKKQESHV